jgi:hypothetical protein
LQSLKLPPPVFKYIFEKIKDWLEGKKTQIKNKTKIKNQKSNTERK